MEPTALIALDELFQDFTRPGAPGGSLVVVQHGEIICQRSYGLADLENNLRLSHTSVFNLGSVSKQFTACAILLLAQADKLSLDDEVHQHLPELPDYGAPLTIHHLLHHTSGLRDTFPGLLVLAEWRESDLTTFADAKHLLFAQRTLNFRPGAEFQYANSNYILLAEICQRASGQRFSTFCRDKILTPLGMTSAIIHDSNTMLVPNRSQGYYPADDGRWLNAPLNDTVLGATNLYASTLDMARWERNFITAQVGGSELICQLCTPGCLDNSTSLQYAGGLVVGSQHRGWEVVEHGGSQGGYAVHFLRFPELELAVIILFNHFRWDTLAQALKVADLFVEDKPGWSAPPPPSPLVPISVTKLEAWAGLYFNPQTRAIRQVTCADGVLHFFGAALQPLVENIFCFVDEPATRLELFHSSDLRPGLKVLAYGETHTYLQMPPLSTENLPLDQYSGAYYAPELDLVWKISANAGHLTVNRRKYPATHPTPVFSDAFRDNWEPLLSFPAEFLLEFDRDTQGQVGGFCVSGLGIRGLKFIKQKG